MKQWSVVMMIKIITNDDDDDDCYDVIGVCNH